MGDVLQIVGSVFLIVAGLAVIIYVLFRRSPVKTGESENEAVNDVAETEAGFEDDPADDVPEGEPPAEIEPERK